MVSEFDEAVEFAFENLKTIKDGKLFERANKVSPEVYFFIGSHTSDIEWQNTVNLSGKDAEIFYKLKKSASFYIRHNFVMPPPLAIWVTDYLDEILEEPTSSGKIGRPQKIGHKEYFLAGLIHLLARKYHLTITRNDVSKTKTSSCDVLSKAINLYYKEFKYQFKPSSYDGLKKLYYAQRKVNAMWVKKS